MTSRHPKQSDKPTTTLQPLVSQPQPAQLPAPLQPAALIQRAAQSPASLTPAEVLQLHRTLGNRAVGQLVQGHLSRHGSGPAAVPSGTIVQPKLLLGPVGDRYEQEADRVAQQVVQRLDAEAPPAAGPAVQRQEEDDKELLQMQPASRQLQPGERGMTVSPDLETAIHHAQGGGHPLPETLRGHMEHAFGADFSGVRIHADADSDVLNRSMQAQAFTTGNEVFFRQGAYEPGSRSGQAVIAHELTHVVQQNGNAVRRSLDTKGLGDMLREGGGEAARISDASGTPGLIQRDIGFEFETQDMATEKSNTGALPAAGFPNPTAAGAVFYAQASTRVQKGEALLKRADIEVQADDGRGGSDLEVVTTHFPLTANGRTRLDNAMTDLGTLINAYTPLANAGGRIVPARALHNTANFRCKMDDGMIYGDFAIAMTGPQVTFGIRAGNVPDIVRDLHGDPNETAPEKAGRDPGRLHMRPPDLVPNEPKALAPGTEANTLVDGHTLARTAMADYRNKVDRNAPVVPELEGLLTIVFTYCESMQRKRAFLKSHTPLMAKTNLATIFWTLPGHVKTYYSQVDNTGKSYLESLVEQAPGYPGKMGQPLFQGVSGLQEDDQATGQPQWYHALTLEDWLRGITLRDRTYAEAFAQFFKDNYGGSAKRPGRDLLTNKLFPGKPAGQEVEGYGALGKRMDRDVTAPGTRLPVFELRSASKLITYAAARQWALDFFDYIDSLNANPGGGHTLMQ